jgi:hypothetical protein
LLKNLAEIVLEGGEFLLKDILLLPFSPVATYGQDEVIFRMAAAKMPNRGSHLRTALPPEWENEPSAHKAHPRRTGRGYWFANPLNG